MTPTSLLLPRHCEYTPQEFHPHVIIMMAYMRYSSRSGLLSVASVENTVEPLWHPAITPTRLFPAAEPEQRGIAPALRQQERLSTVWWYRSNDGFLVENFPSGIPATITHQTMIEDEETVVVKTISKGKTRRKIQNSLRGG